MRLGEKTSTERLVEIHSRFETLASDGKELAFRLELTPLRFDEDQHGDQSVSILFFGKASRAARLFGGIGERSLSLRQEPFRGESGLDFSIGPQNGVSVGSERLIASCVGEIDLSDQPATFEERLGEVAAQAPHAEIRIDEILEFVRHRPAARRQAQPRQESRASLTQERTTRSELAFGENDVGSTTKQICRETGGYVRCQLAELAGLPE